MLQSMTISLITAIRIGDRERALSALHSTSWLEGDLELQGPLKDGTALYWAAANGFTELVAMLLHCGADVNSRTCWGATPLHAACSDLDHKLVVR